MPNAKRINPCGFILRHLTGGFALAARWAGIETIQFVELDPFCCKVLEKNFKGVPIWNDIKTFHGPLADSGIGGNRSFTGNISVSEKRGCDTRGEEVPCSAPSGGLHRGIESDDIKTFTNARRKRQKVSEEQATGIEQRHFLLTGGFPCQPFSCAGKRRGTDDDRHLWPHMLRVIQELRPRWVIAENVSGLVNIKNVVEQGGDADMEDEAIDGGESGVSTSTLVSILTDLEESGYSVQVYIIPACAVGAPHRRDRVWIVGHAKSAGECVGQQERVDGQLFSQTGREQGSVNTSPPDRRAPDSETEGLEGGNATRSSSSDGRLAEHFDGNGRDNETDPWWTPWVEVAQRLCKLDDGVPADMDGRRLTRNKYRTQKLKALGNAIVPLVAYELMKAILEADP